MVYSGTTFLREIEKELQYITLRMGFPLLLVDFFFLFFSSTTGLLDSSVPVVGATFPYTISHFLTRSGKKKENQPTI